MVTEVGKALLPRANSYYYAVAVEAKLPNFINVLFVFPYGAPVNPSGIVQRFLLPSLLIESADAIEKPGAAR